MAADPQDILGSRQHHGFRECARRFCFVIPLVASLLLAGAPQPSSAQTAAEPAPDFVRDIQPIFARSCYACHGPEQKMGELRLDSKQIAFEGGVSHGVIKPGDPEHSPLYQRIAALTAQPRMPMGGELPAAEVELIARWIRQGAAWPDDASVAAVPVAKHWAFIAPERPTPPDVTGDWAKNPIDHFVLARLEKENLQPSPEADKVTLLRRVSLDLIGLPPTVEEIDAFLADHSPNAYEKQVDRLLASPHYGERWGRLWLDAARYADSDGFEKDKRAPGLVLSRLGHQRPQPRPALRPVHHRADRRRPASPTPRRTDLVATGFLRNSMINEEGGIDPEQFRMEAMFDRMDAIGKGILGLTIQCAQCHNHKFDPLKQEEYYRLFAFLNNSYEANIAVYTPEEQAKRDEIFRGIAKIEAGLQRQTPDWRDAHGRLGAASQAGSAGVDGHPARGARDFERRAEIPPARGRLVPRRRLRADQAPRAARPENRRSEHHGVSAGAAQ